MIVWGEAFLGGSGLVISFSQSNKLLHTQRNTSTQTSKKMWGEKSQVRIEHSETNLKQKNPFHFESRLLRFWPSRRKKRWFWSFVSVVGAIAQEARERSWVATTTVCFEIKYCSRRAPGPYTFGGTSQNAVRGPHCFRLNSFFLNTLSKVSARKSTWICRLHFTLHAQGGEVGHGKKLFFPPAAHWWCCHQDGATKTATKMVPTKHPTRWCHQTTTKLVPPIFIT